MGSCILKSSKVVIAPPTSACICKTMAELKESLVFHIFRIHKLILNCRSKIEQCLIKSQKNVAALIKCKEYVLKGKLGELQEFMKYLDIVLEGKAKDKNMKKRLLKDGQIVLKGVNSFPYMDDVNILLENNEAYNSLVRDELKRLGINEKNMSIEIEQEFQKRNTLDGNNFVRRRYTKKVKLSI